MLSFLKLLMGGKDYYYFFINYLPLYLRKKACFLAKRTVRSVQNHGLIKRFNDSAARIVD